MTRIVIGAIESARAMVGLTTAVDGAGLRQCVRQQSWDAVGTGTQHAPPGSVSATSAITSTPTSNLTTPSSTHPGGERYAAHQPVV
jgi:hypothetical protein